MLAGIVWPPLQVRHDVGTTKVATTSMATSKLAPGTSFTVLQVTDFHHLQSERQIDGVIARATSERPDVIALTGDFLHTYQSGLAMEERLLRGLRAASANVFYVRGNHDNWNAAFGSRDDLEGLLARVGIPILDNRHVSVTGGFGTIEVLGTNDPYDGLDELPAASAGADPSRFWLLLTHAPEIRRALPGSGVDLALCGHTHGGQVRLPLIGAVYAPGQGLLPRYSKGWYDEWGGPKLWIDSGMGWTDRPLRFLDQSQVTLLTVRGE